MFPAGTHGFPEGKDRANVGIGIGCMVEKEFLQRVPAPFYKAPCGRPKAENAVIMNVIAGIVPVNGAPANTATADSWSSGTQPGIIATNGGGIPPAMIAGKLRGNCK